MGGPPGRWQIVLLSRGGRDPQVEVPVPPSFLPEQLQVKPQAPKASGASGNVGGVLGLPGICHLHGGVPPKKGPLYKAPFCKAMIRLKAAYGYNKATIRL